MRSQLAIVRSRWSKNQHLMRKAAKQRKKRKVAKQTKNLHNELTDTPMADNKLTDIDSHSLLTVPPRTSYNSERLYNDLDDRKRMLQLQNEIDQREKNQRKEIIDLEQVRQKIQEQKKKLQNEIDKNTFINLVDNNNVMADEKKNAPKDKPRSDRTS